MSDGGVIRLIYQNIGITGLKENNTLNSKK
jgi:hypothetical protein